jgi:hypothetical protein
VQAELTEQNRGQNLLELFSLAYLKSRDSLQNVAMIDLRHCEGSRLDNLDLSCEPYLIELGDRGSETATKFDIHQDGVWGCRKENSQIDRVRTDNDWKLCLFCLRE